MVTFGRGVDTTRMRRDLGFTPELTTAEAFADFAASLAPTGGRAVRAIDGVARTLADPQVRELTGGERG